MFNVNTEKNNIDRFITRRGQKLRTVLGIGQRRRNGLHSTYMSKKTTQKNCLIQFIFVLCCFEKVVLWDLIKTGFLNNFKKFMKEEGGREGEGE